MTKDPYELTNVFDEPDSAEDRASLEEMIAQRPDDARELREQVGLA